jgi:hypothetical protein
VESLLERAAILQAGPGITEQELAAEVSHAMVTGGGSLASWL